jgi:hypothetical protein
MPDFNVRSDSVNVEQIMEQIRSRIREKRGVDYTEEQIRELATVKLQKFLDPRGVRSDLLEQFRKTPQPSPELPNYAFEDTTLFDSYRAPLRFIRRLLRPILKLFFNPNPLIQALNIQSRVNATVAQRQASRQAMDSLYYELIHNLVVETTRLGIEVKNLTMRVESMTSRLEFNERRARALEGAVMYKPAPGDVVAPAPPVERAASGEGRAAQPQVEQTHQPHQGGTPAEGPGQRSRRRRRRRGRRGGGPAAAVMGTLPPSGRGEANEASIHSPAAESFEQAMASESHSAEPPSSPSADTPPPPPSGPEPDSQ